jgi:hypothetical protein
MVDFENFSGNAIMPRLLLNQAKLAAVIVI